MSTQRLCVMYVNFYICMSYKCTNLSYLIIIYYRCNTNEYNYTCPRCNTIYCSLKCYKIHDSKCVTQFYNDSIMSTIKYQKSTRDEQIDMAKKLKKIHENEIKNDDDRLLNENMDELKTLALNDEIDINHLNSYQKAVFEQDLKSGKLNQHLNVNKWKPWWDNNSKIIIDNDRDSNIELIIPGLPIDLPKFKSLKSKNPSKLLPYLLCDILIGYIYGYIKYKGNWNEDKMEIFNQILSISNVLNNNCVYNNFDELYDILIKNWINISIKNCKDDIIFYMKQCCLILENKDNVLRGLYHIYCLLNSIQNDLNHELKKNIKLKSKIPSNNNDIESHADAFMELCNDNNQNKRKSKNSHKKIKNEIKKLNAYKHKIWYYLVWYNEYISDKHSILIKNEFNIIISKKCSKFT